MCGINKQWEDVESYIEQDKFDEAGVAIGTIINELKELITENQLDELLNNITGEVYYE